jgi:DNA-binding MarR family transcriptional regulator
MSHPLALFESFNATLAFLVSLLTIHHLIVWFHTESMSLLFLKTLPRYECLLEASRQFPDLDPSACVAFLNLLRAGNEAFQMAETYLAGHYLSPGRFTVLMLLLDKSKNCPHPRTPAELADLSGVTRATMTGLIDTLERDDFVKREPNPTDRRMMSVNLTAKGQALLNAILPGHFKRMAELMRPLSEDDRKTLVRLLNKILQQSATLSPEPASPPPAVAAV